MFIFCRCLIKKEMSEMSVNGYFWERFDGHLISSLPLMKYDSLVWISFLYFIVMLPTRIGTFNPRTYKGRGKGLDPTPIRNCKFFEKKIYSKGLKRSGAVHSSSSEMLISQFSVCHLWRCQGNRKFLVALTKMNIFDIILCFFPRVFFIKLQKFTN